MYFSLFPLETYGGIYKSCQARSEMTKKKKKLFYTISLVDISVKGEKRKIPLWQIFIICSVQVSIF